MGEGKDGGGGHNLQVIGMMAGRVNKNEGDYRGRPGMGNDSRGRRTKDE